MKQENLELSESTESSSEPIEKNFSGVISDTEAKKIIEAILFAAGYPVTFAKLASVLSISEARVRRIINEYAKKYNCESDVLQRGIILLVFDNSCQLCTKEDYGDYIREALGIRKGGNLSASSIEVLSVIAYNQPVTRVFVDTVRGVDSSYAVNSLLEKNLIEICGRLDVPGRPKLYRTTDDFLRVFGISSLNELPSLDDKNLCSKGETLPLTENIESLFLNNSNDVKINDNTLKSTDV